MTISGFMVAYHYNFYRFSPEKKKFSFQNANHLKPKNFKLHNNVTELILSMFHQHNFYSSWNILSLVRWGSQKMCRLYVNGEMKSKCEIAAGAWRYIMWSKLLLKFRGLNKRVLEKVGGYDVWWFQSYFFWNNVGDCEDDAMNKRN